MSGYPKFANIKYKKERNDTAKDKIFTIIDRKIAVAIKEGGADPANNSKLRDVITKAKANNMSNDTIDRDIKKAAGDVNSMDYEILTCEGYSPNGMAIIMDTLTDNKNCTAINVRGTFTKGGGNVGTSGSVSYMFDKKGQIIIDKGGYNMDPDELMILALDAGAKDFSEEGDSYEVVMVSEGFSIMHEVLETQSIPMMQVDVTMTPQTWAEPTDKDDTRKLDRMLDLLDEDDDVQAVYHSRDE